MRHIIVIFTYCSFLSNYITSALFDESGIVMELAEKIPDFVELAKQEGKSCETHNITTEDGYILTVFHILGGNSSKPLLLNHGVLDSADSFLLRGKDSFAIRAANEGYDVWVTNNRGNRYSRKHVEYNPNTDEKFWDFSIHEMGKYDSPVVIDFILEKTGQDNLSVVGHSEGTTIYFILGSLKPEYNKKIKVFAALAPIVYLHNIRGLLKVLLEISPELNALAILIKYEEFFGFYGVINFIIRQLCSIPELGYDVCANLILFPAMGPDPNNFEPEFLPTVIDHFPAGASRRAIVHYTQIGLSKLFQWYDLGMVGNLLEYKSVKPPLYELDKVSMDVALFCAENDYLSTLEDVEILRNQLPNVVKYHVVDYKLWNHVDYVIGREAHIYLFPSLLELLKEYN